MNNKYTNEDGTPFSKEEFLQKLKTDEEFNDEFGNKGIDQISDLIKQLKDNPDSRRLLVSTWNASDLSHQVLPPCHYGFQVYTRKLSLDERRNWCKNHNVVLEHLEAGLENEEDDMRANRVPTRAISLQWNQRSIDTGLGLPFNIASYGLLLEIIAKIVNMVPDELIGNLGDTHIYLNQIDGIREQLTREPYELPKLRINTEFWPTESGECGVGEFTNNMDSLIKGIEIDDFQIENYISHPKISLPLSN